MEIKGLFRRHSKEGNPDHRSLVFGAESREKVGDSNPVRTKETIKWDLDKLFRDTISFIYRLNPRVSYCYTHTHGKRIYQLSLKAERFRCIECRSGGERTIAVLLITAPDCATVTRNQEKESNNPPVPIAKPFFRQYGFPVTET